MKKAGACVYTEGFSKIFAEIVIIACFTAGASLTIWLGDVLSLMPCSAKICGRDMKKTPPISSKAVILVSEKGSAMGF